MVYCKSTGQQREGQRAQQIAERVRGIECPPLGQTSTRGRISSARRAKHKKSAPSRAQWQTPAKATAPRSRARGRTWTVLGEAFWSSWLTLSAADEACPPPRRISGSRNDLVRAGSYETPLPPTRKGMPGSRLTRLIERYVFTLATLAARVTCRSTNSWNASRLGATHCSA